MFSRLLASNTFCRRDGRRRNSDEKDTNAKDATCQRCKILCILNFKVYSLSWECNIRRNFLIADGHSWTKGQQSRPLLRNYNPPHNILIHAFLNAFLSEWGQCSTSTKIKIQRYLVKKLVMPFIFFDIYIYILKKYWVLLLKLKCIKNTSFFLLTNKRKVFLTFFF